MKNADHVRILTVGSTLSSPVALDRQVMGHPVIVDRAEMGYLRPMVILSWLDSNGCPSSLGQEALYVSAIRN